MDPPAEQSGQYPKAIKVMVAHILDLKRIQAMRKLLGSRVGGLFVRGFMERNERRVCCTLLEKGITEHSLEITSEGLQRVNELMKQGPELPALVRAFGAVVLLATDDEDMEQAKTAVAEMRTCVNENILGDGATVEERQTLKDLAQWAENIVDEIFEARDADDSEKAKEVEDA